MIHEIRLSDISPYCVIRDLVKNLWVILLVTAIAMMGATMVRQYTHEDRYVASVTYYVSMRDSTNSVYSNLKNANRVAIALTDVFGGDIMRRMIAEEAGRDLSDVGVSAYVPMGTTNLLRVNITACCPYEAYRVARAYMNHQHLVSEYIFDNAMLDVLQAPEVPAYPVNPVDYRSIQLRAGLIGFALTTMLIIALTVLRDSVMTESAAREKLGTPLVGTLAYEAKNKTLRSKMRKTNKSIRIDQVGVSFPYAEAVKKICSKIAHTKKLGACRAIMVTSAMENEGKTTVAVNVALGLAERGFKVLLLDGDIIRPSVHRMLDRQNTASVDFVRAIRGKSTAPQVTRYDERMGIYLAYNRRGYSDSSEALAAPGMAKLMSAWRAEMDFIIIDTPPASVAADTEIIANHADAAVLVVAQDLARTRMISDAIDRLQNVELIGTIFNNVRGRIGTAVSYYGKKSYGKYYASAR